ncbi:MAG: L-histidine N(alpha)-methyltransferase [Ferruginibacter sp.]|nr:L-histidine N(alpha)-methyltransferase [Cytophagales bacterium]
MRQLFAQDVQTGLSANPKRLSSRYFYDERGNRLFQDIMGLKEYYLTRSEFEILTRHQAALLHLFRSRPILAEESQRQVASVAVEDHQEGEDNAFELIEFGAGDGLKIKVLLRHFLAQRASFRYVPIDISADAVNGLVADLRATFPELETEGVQDEYFKALDYLKTRSQVRKVVLFLGANIGNFNEVEAIQFLTSLRRNLSPDDLLMIGFDLKKDPSLILAAYNDASGVTRDFNLNLLQRINRELGGDFNPDHFQHYPTYDPTSGEARSFLLSRKHQTVRIAGLDAAFEFEAWEPIHTEISRKYDLRTIVRLAQQSGYQVVQHFFDRQQYFVDTVWRVGRE